MTPNAAGILFGVLALVTWFAHIPTRPELLSGKKPDLAMPAIDPAMAADLMAAALSGGSSIPTALTSLHRALGEEAEGSGLDVAARTLLMGGTWAEAWQEVPSRFDPLKESLEPAWADGAAPLQLLARTAAGIRERRVRTAREAAAELGTRLVLPLGICFLPAFVLVGIVPVIASAGLDIFG